MIKEMYPNYYPVSQLANIGEDKIYKTNFKKNILINPLFSGSPPVLYTYPQHWLCCPQNSNYFPIVQCQIHIAGSKKNNRVCLASFDNHQYGLSKEIRKNTISEIGF
jgi:hypothetical protein